VCPGEVLPDRWDSWEAERKHKQPAGRVLGEKPQSVVENGHTFPGKGRTAIGVPRRQSAFQPKQIEIQPIDGAFRSRHRPGPNDVSGDELEVLVGVGCLAGYLADQVSTMVPDVEITAVPIPTDDQVGGDSNATDVVRHRELELQFESAFVSLLNERRAVGAVFRDRYPDGVCIGCDPAGMESVAVLKLDAGLQMPVLERKHSQVTFARRSIDGGYPQMRAVRVDALDVIRFPFQGQNPFRLGEIDLALRGGNQRCRQHESA
jgi:hypothetical protein